LHAAVRKRIRERLEAQTRAFQSERSQEDGRARYEDHERVENVGGRVLNEAESDHRKSLTGLPKESVLDFQREDCVLVVETEKSGGRKK